MTQGSTGTVPPWTTVKLERRISPHVGVDTATYILRESKVTVVRKFMSRQNVHQGTLRLSSKCLQVHNTTLQEPWVTGKTSRPPEPQDEGRDTGTTRGLGFSTVETLYHTDSHLQE